MLKNIVDGDKSQLLKDKQRFPDMKIEAPLSPELMKQAYSLFPSLEQITPMSEIDRMYLPEEAPQAEEVVPQETSVSRAMKMLPQNRQQQVEESKQVIQPQMQQAPMTDTEMEDAINERNRIQNISAFGNIGENLLANTNKEYKANSELYQNMSKQANQGITDIATKREDEKSKIDLQRQREMNDANSDISKLARKTLKELSPGLAIPENFSMAQVEKIFPSISQAINAKESREDRALRQKEIQANREIANQDKARRQTEEKMLKWESSAMKQPAYKRYQENQEPYMLAAKLASGEIKSNGVSDAALALQGIKLFQADNSVVRESDQKLFASVGGLKQDAQTLQQKLLGGGRFTQEVRDAFVKQMIQAQNNLKQAAKEQTSHLYKKFKDAGVSDDEIPGTLREINTLGSKPKGEIKRIADDGTVAIYDQNKKFLRFE